jgi:hypothetical protein
MTIGFSLFDTAIGHCGIAWSIYGIRQVQLPEMQGLQQTPPTHVQDAIFRIASLLAKLLHTAKLP